ncbi:MAG: polyphosphate polymerase domain-containing protein [Bacteroidales bacterium]
MNNIAIQVDDILNTFRSVNLPEMEEVGLLNRVDTKYVFQTSLLPFLLEKMSGSYNILEIENNRIFKYNTTYLDTDDFLFFNQHVTGKLNRLKIRYREYVESGKTFLEIKKRTNTDRTVKWRIRSTLNGSDVVRESDMEFIRQHVPIDTMTLKPVLLIKFSRATFPVNNINLKERVTLDMDISFADLDGNYMEIPGIAVMELKKEGYSVGQSSMAAILKDFHIRPMAFSKYCLGIALLKDIPGKNILKPQLLFLNRLKDEYNKCFRA